ncbi:hypothetical protein PTKU15_12050 [Paraburkholderia terrae]|nr:hypothetical protein PTKU15_12050 [Paraburkholderia terrae]
MADEPKPITDHKALPEIPDELWTPKSKKSLEFRKVLKDEKHWPTPVPKYVLKKGSV